MIKHLFLAGYIVVGQPATGYIEMKDNTGGRIGDFLDFRDALMESGTPVHFKGKCQSACAMLYKEGDCVYPTAEFWFHLPYDHERQRVMDTPYVHEWLDKHHHPDIVEWYNSKGGLSEEWLILKGVDMMSILDVCPNTGEGL